MKRQLSLLAAASTLAITGVATPAQATPPELPPHSLRLEHVTFADACHPNDTSIALSDDGTGMMITTDSFTVEAGRIKPTDGPASWQPGQTKHCRMTGVLKHPSGWRLTARGWGFHGFASLAEGARGSATSQVTFGKSTLGPLRWAKSGAFMDTFDARTSDDLTAVSECGDGTPFTVTERIRVSAGSDSTETSYLALDTSDGRNNTLSLSWERC